MTADKIQISYPDDMLTNQLEIVTNGCELKIHPQDIAEWLIATTTGKVESNKKPRTETENHITRVIFENIHSQLTNMFRVAADTPVFKIDLSLNYKFDLVIDHFQDFMDVDLGHTQIRDLSASVKTAHAHMNFSDPNPVTMRRFNLEGLSSRLEVRGLANANFKELIFTGSAGSLMLYLDGKFQQDARIELRAKEAPTTVYIPRGLAVQVRSEDGNLDSEDIEFAVASDYTRKDGCYYTQAALDGQSPQLDILVTKQGPLEIDTI